MKRFLILFLGLLLLSNFAFAKEIAGVNIPDTYTVGNEQLVLNGVGIRKKFFIKVYVGALYVQKKSNKASDILAQDKKAIRMHFLYKKVSSKKMKGAFKEGLEKIDEQFAKSKEAEDFLSFFNFDVVKGDDVDLIFDGSKIIVKHNGNVVGEVDSKKLSDIVMLIYIGDEPADKGLKKGLLGD